MNTVAFGLFLVPVLVQGAASEDIQISRVFGPEEPGAYKHPACVAELENGDLYLVYYCGSGEYGTDTCVYGARLPGGKGAWTKPEIVADTPFRADGNGVVWQAPAGRVEPDRLVWLFYVCRYGDTWSDSLIKYKVSKDGAHTWSDSDLLTFERGTMVRGHPILLNDGDYLLPIYHETGHDPEFVGPHTTSLFLRYNPKKKEWTESGRIVSPKGNLQPAPVQLTDDYLIAYCRRGGGYDACTDGYIIRSESHDGGRTWGPGVNSAFQNPNAAVDFIKLQNGHLLLVYNDSMTERTPMTAAISVDNDKTYPYRRNIVAGNDDFAYPSVIQTKDGKIHVVFTSQQRTMINHAVFDESAILGQPAKPAK